MCRFYVWGSSTALLSLGIVYTWTFTLLRPTLPTPRLSNRMNRIVSSSSSSSNYDNVVNVDVLDNDNDDEVQIQQTNLQRIAPRPRNVRLVFLGDSLTRYQYLSLAYFLRYGEWYNPGISATTHNLMNAHSFHHPLHPRNDWNEYFFQSNQILYPMEVCDCYRDENTILERRYFEDTKLNNRLVYLNMNGNLESSKYKGRILAKDVFPNFNNLVGMPFGTNDTNATVNFEWEFDSWGQVIEHYVRYLFSDEDQKEDNNNKNKKEKEEDLPVYVILNAGIHPHDFGMTHNLTSSQEIQSVLVNASSTTSTTTTPNLHGIWKTTTFHRSQVVPAARSLEDELDGYTIPPEIRTSDATMCHLLHHCLNISWTAHLQPSLYYDDLHFLEPVHRIINEQMLQELHLLPNNYYYYHNSHKQQQQQQLLLNRTTVMNFVGQ